MNGIRFFIAAVLMGVTSPGAAQSAVTPDPGGPLAWGAGLALLADPGSGVAVFDHPARISATAHGTGLHFSLAASRARLFELDALVRRRFAFAAERGGIATAVGVESFGPEGASRTRVVAGARVAPGEGSRAIGVAWQELRGEGENRAGALDAGVVTHVPGAGGRLTLSLAVRGLASGGDPALAPDPDWTLEAAWDAGPAAFHLARTRDLSAARTGGGVRLAFGVCTITAGMVGPPAVWSLAIGARGGPFGASFARTAHPVLGVSDAIDGSISW